MGNFLTAWHTDVGIKKATNQDSILLKVLSKEAEEIVFAVVCDGMGGMSKGELASATVIRAFEEWFTTVYTQKGTGWKANEIEKQWNEVLEEVNQKLIQYGKMEGIQLGTTVTAVLVNQSGEYYVGHIGDTRAYRISEFVEQLTEDHTLVASEVKRGNMTIEQAKTDSRRNVLLQCIGVNQFFEMQFLFGKVDRLNAMLLCSDGFRHMITEEELLMKLGAERINSNIEAKNALVELVELNKQRKETDNISAVYLRLN